MFIFESGELRSVRPNGCPLLDQHSGILAGHNNNPNMKRQGGLPGNYAVGFDMWICGACLQSTCWYVLF